MNDKSKTPNVAIVGRPNVGKSALFNRLVGRKIAIVHDQPGITRDRISAVCNRASRPFMVWDTGGVGGAGESELLAQVRETAEKAINESELLLLLVDAQQGLSPIDEELARMLRKSRKPIVLVINKIDDPKHEDLATDFARLGFETSISISAAHGRGISELLEAIDKILPPPGSQNGRPTTAPPIHDSPIHEIPPLAVAVIGRPNAGKSSLINAIVQSERAIVSELPGTKRDAVGYSLPTGRRSIHFYRYGRNSTARQTFQLGGSIQRHARGAKYSPRQFMCADRRPYHRCHRSGQKDRGPDSKGAQGIYRCLEQMGLD